MTRILKAPVVALLLFLVVIGGTVPAAVFPVATNPAVLEFSGGAVALGTNYFVGYVVGTNITGQLVSGAGQLVGAPLLVGANPGFPPAVAIAGARTNCLVAWSDRSLASGVTMFGQLIDTNGSLSGAKFPLLPAVGGHGFQYVQAAVSEGTNFLVVWQDAASGDFYGQWVRAAGTLKGSEFYLFTLANGVGDRNISVTFGQTNCLIVWQSGNNNNNNTYGMLLAPGGGAGTPVQLNTTPSLDKNPVAAGFDGTNFLVVWDRDTQTNGSGQALWQLCGRFLSPAGVALGGEQVLVTELASFPALAFDGDNYLLAWGFDTTTTNADRTIHARFLDRSAAAIGPIFTPFPPQGTNSPLLPLNGVFFDGSRFVLTATYGAFILSPSGDVAGFTGGDVYATSIPTSTQPPRFTQATVADGFFQGLLRVVPGQVYTIETSTNLLSWQSRGTASSDATNVVALLDPQGVTNNPQLFYRAVVGNRLGATIDFHLLEFAQAGGFGSGYTPAVSFPVILNSYSAAVRVQDDYHLPAVTNVYFTGPAGAGLNSTPGDPNNSYVNSSDAFYQSPIIYSPALAPGGTWTVNYHGTNISYTVPDPQAAARLVVPLPTVTVSGDVVQSVAWAYRQATTGAALPGAPAYLTGIIVEIQALDGSRIYDSPTLDPGTTHHTLGAPVNWSNVQGIFMAYDDTLGNHYVVSFAKP